MSQFLTKTLRHLRRQLLDAPRGFGRPTPAAVFDREYAGGRWDLLLTEDERPRYETLARLITAAAARPRVLDLGCGSGRLAQVLAPARPVRWLGVDLSSEGLRRARALGLDFAEFAEGDFEVWRPPADEQFDAVVFNECLGYARDPRATVKTFAPFVRPGGVLLVSYYRSGNWRAIWRRITAAHPVVQATVVDNARGQTWDIRTLRPACAPRGTP